MQNNVPNPKKNDEDALAFRSLPGTVPQKIYGTNGF